MASGKPIYKHLPIQGDAVKRLKTSVLNTLSDIVAFYPSADIRPTWINQAFLDASGYSKAALLSMTCHQCWFQSDTPCSFCPVLKTFETEKPHELKVQTSKGRFWYIRSFPMFNENGSFEGVFQMGRDITDRKNAEIALRESEAKFRGILNNIGDGYYEVDLHGNLTFFNDSLCELLGYSRDELMGMNYRAFMLAEDVDLVFKTFNRVFATGIGAKGSDWRFFQKDGSVRYLDISVSLIGDAEGNIRNFGGIVRDVTERRQAEKALRISEEKYRYLFEGIPVGLYQTTMDGRIIDANQACLQIFHCPSKDELLIHDARKSYVDPKDGDLFRRQLIKNGYIKDYETRLWRWDGSIVWVSIIAHVIYDDLGNVSGIEGSIKDISERKEKEKQLQASETKYRGLAERCSDIVVLVEKTGSRVYWSPSSERILGYSRDELMDRRPEELMGSAEYARMREYISRIIEKGGAAENLDGRMVKKDGTEIIIEWTATPVYHGQQLTGIQFVGRDITTRKKSEEALRKSHKELQSLAKHLESAREQERMTIAREVHDDLGQALTAIKFDLSWMKRHLPDGGADKLMGKIETATKMVNEAIQSVKSISTRLRPEILNDLGLEAAIEWYLDDFRKRTGIDCRSSIQSLTFASDCMCDQLCISVFRIFQEALTNVARHSRATEIFVKLKKSDGRIEFEVNDNGVGINETYIDGSGAFGLVGIRERVNAFGGKMGISGSSEEGTTLKVVLPFISSEDSLPES